MKEFDIKEVISRIENVEQFYKDLKFLLKLDAEIKRRKNLFNPVNYGFPDLFFSRGECQGYFKDGIIVRDLLDDDETEEEFRLRQRKALVECIEDHLYIVKDGVKRKLHLIDKQIDFIYDLFFGYEKYAILWKSRGGGGSLAVAILIFLCMIYRHMSFIDLAGSGEQAKNVYNYVCQFWDCKPEMKWNVLDGDPLLSHTKMKNGVQLKCIAASPKQTRGKHSPGMVIDEGCQEDRRMDEIFLSAINSAMSEPEHLVAIVSTFHVPVGFYQEFWDKHNEKGFKRYKWDCYDTMSKCFTGINIRYDDNDVNGLKFCRESCPLTDVVIQYDEDGNEIGRIYEGCDGKARNSHGWAPRHAIISAKKLNDYDTFRVEFECKRPKFKGPIFGRENIERSIVDDIEIDVNTLGVVGIDWGYSTEGAMVLLKNCGDYIGVVDAKHLSQQKTQDWIDQLNIWKNVCSDIIIYADGSHPMCNRDVEEAGFDLYPVYFQRARDYAEHNLKKYFNFGKIKIMSNLERLLDQLFKYRKNDKGMIIKEDDHGPDALEAAMIHFDFMDMYGGEIKSSLKKFRDEDLSSNDTVQIEEF